MQTQESGTRVQSRLDNAMAELDPQSRQVMEMWLDGADPVEIAETLGLSERAVTVIRDSSVCKLREAITAQPCPDEANLLESTGK